MRSFHAHLYFPVDELPRARQLLAQASSLPYFTFSGLSAHPIGPHPLPMIELHFDELQHPEARAWLNAHRNGFSVLIHADTGDDVKDHSEGIEWLGDPVELDFGFFELILRRPEFKVHP